MKEWVKSLEFGIEECILFSIIVLNVLDAFEILPPDFDYVKKIISWSAIGVMFVHARLDKIIAGVKEPKGAYLLIIGFFLLTIKNLVGYARSIYTEASSFLLPFYTALLENAVQLERIGIAIGLLCLFAGSMRLALKGIKKPSLAYALLQKEHSKKEFLKSTAILFFFSLLFFIGIFNIASEWLAIAIDAPLLMIGIVFFIFHIYRSHKFEFQTTWLSYFGSFGMNWYEKIIKELKYRKYLLQVAAIIVAAYGITDALIFLWPAVIGVGDQLYLGSLLNPHPSIWSLLTTTTITEGGAQLLIYLANVWTLGVLLCLPAYVWIKKFKNEEIRFHPVFIAGSLASALLTVFVPGFVIDILHGGNIFGLDIYFRTLPISTLPFFDWILIAGAIAIGIEIAAHKHQFQELTQTGLIILFITAFSLYILAYSASLGMYYQQTIAYVFMQRSALTLLFAALYAGTILIICAGLVGLWKETWWHIKKHHHAYHRKRTIDK